MEDKIITISMKAALWNVVLNALAGRPFAEVAQIINEMQNQAGPQMLTDQAPTNKVSAEDNDNP